MLDINEDTYEIPDVKYNSVVKIPSTDFQKICRDMVNISDEIEIKAVDNSLILTCKGEFAEQETVIGECSSNGISFCQNTSSDSEIIQGIFSLKYPLYFIVLIIGVTGSAYAIFGGLKSVAVSDTINGLGLLIGGLAIPVLALVKLGGGGY